MMLNTGDWQWKSWKYTIIITTIIETKSDCNTTEWWKILTWLGYWYVYELNVEMLEETDAQKVDWREALMCLDHLIEHMTLTRIVTT